VDNLNKPITEIIRQRFSCRTYLRRGYSLSPIAADKRQRLEGMIADLQAGPLGTPLRFALVAATEQDASALKGLGTYGFIKGASGFIVGAMRPAEKGLEDYGYGMEQIILLATDLELGTCWLGGSFTRSSFARRISVMREEQMPAVTAIGEIADPEQARDTLLRRRIGADRRLPWDKLFFQGSLNAPLTPEGAGAYATPLDMVRLGPSASNRQPWRIVQEGNAWHFYLQRTGGYPGGLATRLLRIADMQRVDMGIAMCHFELTARALGLKGTWTVCEPAIAKPDALTEYTVSWTD
jgi:hypothetical protein